MNTITTITSISYRINKSKFIGYSIPYNEFDSHYKICKSRHPRANHFVYAIRYINKLHHVVEKQCDDGEPKGSSGKPVLAVIRGADLINTAIVIVRYFGGIRLGIGGLIRAYTHSAQRVIQESQVQVFRTMKKGNITISYHMLDKFKYLLKKLKGHELNIQFHEDFVSVSFSIPEDQISKFSHFNRQEYR